MSLSIHVNTPNALDSLALPQNQQKTHGNALNKTAHQLGQALVTNNPLATQASGLAPQSTQADGDTPPTNHTSFQNQLLALHSQQQKTIQANQFNNQHLELLPATPTDQQGWTSFIQSGALAPYKQELLQTLKECQTFITQNSKPSTEQTRALTGIQSFIDNKINCPNKKLHSLTFNTTRTELKRLSALLKNANLPLDVRRTQALEAFGALGVCAEGESLHIQEAVAKLQPSLSGLDAKILDTKNLLIEQHLQTLVRHEGQGRANLHKMEIHHVQGLKNAVAKEWGLTERQDANINRSFQAGIAPIAKALLQQTVTPEAIASHISENLHAQLNAHLSLNPANHGATIPYNQKIIHELSNLLQVELGDAIGLHDILTASDDYSSFQLNSKADIHQAVVNALQNKGIQTTPSNSQRPILETIKSLAHLRNESALFSPPTTHMMLWASGFNSTQNGLDSDKDKNKHIGQNPFKMNVLSGDASQTNVNTSH